MRVAPPHAKLASGRWPSSAGRDSLTRRVATKGFRVRVTSSFLELFLTQRHPPFGLDHRLAPCIQFDRSRPLSPKEANGIQGAWATEPSSRRDTTASHETPGQNCQGGPRATRCRGLLRMKNGCLEVHGKDRYGRVIGDVFVGDKLANEIMVRDGWAWRFVKYSKSSRLAELEGEARAGRRGLSGWRTPHCAVGLPS